jgi:DNA-binding GntR family transcriptional regulator
MTRPDTPAIATEILRQAASCRPGSSISPSDVAQALAPGEDAWRPLLGPVREAAFALARQGTLEILRKGKPVPPPGPEGVRGVIRMRLAAPLDEAPSQG